MRTILLLAAICGLPGCVAYGVPYAGAPYGDPYYGGNAPYVVQQPPAIYGRPGYWRGAPAYGRRDRDRDGIPDRFDRDRDGDGVPNRQDARPNNPRRY